MSQLCKAYTPSTNAQEHYAVEAIGHRALESLGVPLAVDREDCRSDAYRIGIQNYFGVQNVSQIWCTLPQQTVNERLIVKNFIPKISPVVIKLEGIRSLEWTSSGVMNVKIVNGSTTYFFLDPSIQKPKWTHFRLNYQSRSYSACQDDIYAPYQGQETILKHIFKTNPAVRVSGGIEDAVKAFQESNALTYRQIVTSQRAA